jgi:hypothetical protein
MTTLSDNALRAGMAFTQATEDAGNYIDSMMQEYGWTMPGADGTYSTVNAGDAFDPNNMLQFGENGNATVNADALAQQAATGKYGGKGLFSDVARTGGSEEASAVSQAMGRGLGTGSGLAKQQRSLAEDITAKNMGLTSEDMFKRLFGQYGTVRGAYKNVNQGKVLDDIANGVTGSGYVSTTGS